MVRTASASTRTRPVTRRRSLLRITIGATVVLAAPLMFATITLRDELPHSVLTAGKALPVGHPVTREDLRSVEAAAPGAILALQADRVVGRLTSMPVAKGALITESVLGESAYPPPGQGLVGVAVRPGQLPQRLARGVTVNVVVDADPTTDTKPLKPMTAVVAEVTPPASAQQPTLVDLLMTKENAQVVASAGDRIRLVQVGAE